MGIGSLLLRYGYRVVQRCPSNSALVYEAEVDRPRPASAAKYNQRVVIKVQKVASSDGHLYDYAKELEFYRLAQDHRFGVKVLDAFSLGQLAIIVLEAWDETLGTFLAQPQSQANTARLNVLLQRKLRRMRQLGLVHGDLLPKNMVCRVKNDQLVDIAIIDYGLSFYESEMLDAVTERRSAKSRCFLQHLDTLWIYIFDPRHWSLAMANRRLNFAPSLSEVAEEPSLLDESIGNLVHLLAHDTAFRAEFGSKLL